MLSIIKAAVFWSRRDLLLLMCFGFSGAVCTGLLKGCQANQVDMCFLRPST